MSDYLQQKYINILGSRLKLFKRNGDIWMFRCPLCGDSKKNKFKTRGYFYYAKHSYAFKCHNCAETRTFHQFLKEQNIDLYKEYVLEKFQDEKPIKKKDVEIEHISKTNVKFKKNIFSNITKFKNLPDDHEIVKYIKARKIPEKYYDIMYYTEEFKKFVNTCIPHKFPEIKRDHPRLIITKYDENNNIIGFQGRTIDPKVIPKYIKINLQDDESKLNGLNRIDDTKIVYVVEGVFDSMFLDNCVAMDTSSTRIPFDNYVMILDNEPRNREIVNVMSRVINDNKKIVIWPKEIPNKIDINDLILKGFTKDKITDIINKNTFSGLQAKLKFNQWRKY